MYSEIAVVMTVAQAAIILQCSERLVRTMMANGVLEQVRLGRSVRIPRHSLMRLIAPHGITNAAREGPDHETLQDWESATSLRWSVPECNEPAADGADSCECELWGAICLSCFERAERDDNKHPPLSVVRDGRGGSPTFPPMGGATEAVREPE